MADSPAKPATPDSKWGGRLAAGKAYRDRQRPEWNANRTSLVGRSVTHPYLRLKDKVNLAWAAFQTMVGTVYARNPEPIIRETVPELQLTARMLTAITKEDMTSMRARYVTRLAIADVFWAGFGIVLEKLQHDITSAAFRYTPEGQKEKDEKKGKDTTDGLLPTPENQRYSLHRLHPESILLDPAGTSTTLSDHKWVSLEFYPTLHDLKTDDMFDKFSEETEKGLLRVRVAPAIQERTSGLFKKIEQEDASEDPEFIQVRVQEVWDRVNREILYIPTGSEKIIGKRDWPVELRYGKELLLPLSVLYFNESPDEFWPIPEISVVRPQLEQYSNLFVSILQDAVTKWRRFIYRSDLVQRGHVDRLIAGGATEAVGIDGQKWAGRQDFPLEAVFAPIQDPYVKQDMLGVLSMVKQQVHEIIGAGDFASAGMRPTRSATEAAALSDFLRSRMTNRTENLDAFFIQMITNHVLYLQETAVESRRIEMLDKDGAAVFREYTKNDLQGEFRFSVVAGSSMPENTESRRQENIAFFQQVLPAVMQTGGDPRPLIEFIAPYYKMPQHLLDQIYKGHRQALMQCALMMKEQYFGVPHDPEQFMELVSQAIMSGLTVSEISAIDQQAFANASKKQPVSLPGTNTTDQTVS